MREILFRGKRIDNGKMVEGSYCPKKAGHYEGDRLVEEIQHLIIVNMNGGGYQYAEIDPETVCQYTGLTDKDSKKIFEGDILSFIDRECPDDILRELVAWNGFSWVTRRCKRDVVMSEWECEHMEVTGNIFDNPELLEGESK